MVANAGIVHLSPIIESNYISSYAKVLNTYNFLVDVDKWDHSFNVNIRGVMLCYKHAARQMIKQGRGGRMIGIVNLVPVCRVGCLTKSVYISQVHPRLLENKVGHIHNLCFNLPT